MKEEFIIERTNKDKSYTVISRHKNYDDAINALEKIESDLRHEVWCKHWVTTTLGFMPIAWIN